MAEKVSSARNEFRNTAKELKEKPKPSPKEEKGKDKSLRAFPKASKIIGLLLISISVYALFSMISFLFSWQNDQSYIQNLSWEKISHAQPEITDNWMGLFGAWLSHFLIFKSFGISSFLFLPFLFLAGFRLLYGSTPRSLVKTFSYTSLSVIYFTVFFGFAGDLIKRWFNSESYIGGQIGYELQQTFSGLVGTVGVAIILVIAALIFLVAVYNLSFKLPKFKFRSEEAPMIYKVEEAAVILADNLDHEGIPLTETFAEALAKEEDIDVDEIQIKAESGKPKADTVKNIEFKVTKPVPVAEAEDIPGQQEDEPNRQSWYQYPSTAILKDYTSNNAVVDASELQERKNLILKTLENYKITIDRIEATVGPTVTLYEVVPAPGIRISKIKSLEDDIALSLSALGIRIIAPMPGKGTIGIEVPNQNPEIVSLKEALNSPAFKNSNYELPVVLGKTISNEVFVKDLTSMPHLLMAGATGQGKSVGINTIIASILFKRHPDDVKFILVDPKKVELSLFKNIEKHFLPELPDGQEAIITDTQMVVHVLKSLCHEMDERYNKLKDAHVRNIKEYNKKIERGLLTSDEHQRLPYIILVIDELADLMMTAGKEVELPIARLAQLARAIGIHLIVATQRPSVNIITGVIKANFPSRIAFRVSSRIDARTILDAGGAEQLVGRGDMLYSTGNDVTRLQCPFIDTDEVETLTKFIQAQPYPIPFRLNIIKDDEDGDEYGEMDGELDPLFEDAARLVVQTKQGSTSMLQRRLKLGYNRAGRLMDQLEKAKVVGGNEGSKAREVLIADEYALEQFLSTISK